MTKLEQTKDAFHNFIWNAKLVLKVVMYQIALALMILGVLYVTNFKVSIVKNVQVISPIVEGAK